MENKNKWIIVLMALIANTNIIYAQKEIMIDLQQAIAIANDSSLETLRTQSLFLSGYWEYQAYKAKRLPGATLNLTPVEYNRDIIKRYDSNQNIDIYRLQQSYYAYGNLAISQNFPLTGGTFYLSTDLSYMRSFGNIKQTQFSSIPIRLGYTQELVGFNLLKWEKKIEPIKYEKTKKEFTYNMEMIARETIKHFFNLAIAQAEYDLAKEDVSYIDTLYNIGIQRYQLSTLSKSDFLTIRLDSLNAYNTLYNKSENLKTMMFSLSTFLKLDPNLSIKLKLPVDIPNIEICQEEAIRLIYANNPKMLEIRQQILEARKNVDKTLKESHFNISIDASLGFNQYSDRLKNAYSDLMQQDLLSISITIPLIDWGVRKGKYNMARNNLKVVTISSDQNKIKLEEEVTIAINKFKIQYRIISSTEQALNIADMVYFENFQRFISGKIGFNDLTIATKRKQESRQNYIIALQNFWSSYYEIRQLTLFDFIANMPISETAKKLSVNINNKYFYN